MQSFLGKRGDSYDRFLIRVREMYESIHIVFQVLANLTNNHRLSSNDKNTDVDFLSFFDFLYKVKKNQLNKKTKYTSMENLISHFKKYSEGVKVPKGFTYNAVEAPKGEFGVALISDPNTNAPPARIASAVKPTASGISLSDTTRNPTQVAHSTGASVASAAT